MQESETIVETWQPQIGERVRVRVNAECQYCTDTSDPKERARVMAQDGREGVVVKLGHDRFCCAVLDERDPLQEAHLTHTVWVLFDEERPEDERTEGDPFDAHFAPQELESADTNWTCVTCLYTVIPGADHDCRPDGSYICCACLHIVHPEERRWHPCGPCQCHPREGP